MRKSKYLIFQPFKLFKIVNNGIISLLNNDSICLDLSRYINLDIIPSEFLKIVKMYLIYFFQRAL